MAEGYFNSTDDPRMRLMATMLSSYRAPKGNESALGVGAENFMKTFMLSKMMKDEGERRNAASDERKNALALAIGKPAETTTTPGGTTINWNEQKPNMGLAAQSLGPNNSELQEKLMLHMMGASGKDTPSAIQEYEYFNKLSPAEKNMYLQSKRQTVVPGMVINSTGGAQEIPGFSNLQSNFEQMKQAGGETGKLSAQAGLTGGPSLAGIEGAKKAAELGEQGLSDIDKSLGEIDDFNSAVGRYKEAIAGTTMTGPVAGMAGDITKDAGRTNLISAQNELTLRAKGLLGMPSSNFSDADRNFLTEIAGGRYATGEGLQKATARLEQMAGDQKKNLMMRKTRVMERAIKNTPAGRALQDVPASFDPGSTDPMAPPLARDMPKRVRIDANGNIVK